MSNHDLSPKKQKNMSHDPGDLQNKDLPQTQYSEGDNKLIQGALTNPSNLTLTPKIVQRMASLYGNQFVQKLVQKPTENVSPGLVHVPKYDQHPSRGIQRLVSDQPVNRGQLKYKSTPSQSKLDVEITFTPTNNTPHSTGIYIEQYLVNLSPIGDPTTFFSQQLSSEDRIKQQTLPLGQIQGGYIVDHIEGELNLLSAEGQANRQKFETAYQQGTLHYYINAGVAEHGQKGSYSSTASVPAILRDSPAAPGVPMKYTFIALVHDRQNGQYLGQVKWGYEIVDAGTSRNVFADSLVNETVTIGEPDPAALATVAQAKANFYNYYAMYLDPNVVGQQRSWMPILDDLNKVYKLVFNTSRAVYPSPSDEPKAKAMMQPSYINYPNVKAYRSEVIRRLQDFYGRVKTSFSQPSSSIDLTPLNQIQNEAKIMSIRIQTVQPHYDAVWEALLANKFSDQASVIEIIKALINCKDYREIQELEDKLLQVKIS